MRKMDKEKRENLELLAEKGVLAWVLKGLVEEYKESEIQKIISFIKEVQIQEDEDETICDIYSLVKDPNGKIPIDLYVKVLDMNEETIEEVHGKFMELSMIQAFSKWGKISNKKIVIWILNNIEIKYANSIKQYCFVMKNLMNGEEKKIDDFRVFIIGINTEFGLETEDIVQSMKS